MSTPITDGDLSKIKELILKLEQDGLFEKYQSLIPISFVSKSSTQFKKSEKSRIQEWNPDDKDEFNDQAIILMTKKAINTIHRKRKANTSRSRWRAGSSLKTVYSNFEVFNDLAKLFVDQDKHTEWLRLISSDRNPNSNSLRVRHVAMPKQISDRLMKVIINNGGATEKFVEFLSEKDGLRYFSVDAKKKLVSHFIVIKRRDLVFQLYGNISTTLDSFIINNSPKSDLPFLVGTKGKSSKAALQKKMKAK